MAHASIFGNVRLNSNLPVIFFACTYAYTTIEHVHILAYLVTSSISQLEKLVSSLAASLARAPK